MKIAAYCRVSTDKDDQLNSLKVQKAFFAEYAKKYGHELAGLYADEGISGTGTKRRKEFKRMMADAERGLFSMLVVKDISRLARNTVDLLQSVRKLKAMGIETVFLTAGMTSMGDSEFVLTVFGALAQEESRSTSKRVKFSKRINAEKGRVPNLVYGYNKVPGDYFSLSVCQSEAEVVRRIYGRYTADGWGAGKIARELNDLGLLTKRGCSWSQNAVCRILTNPIYTGRVTNGKEEIADFLTGRRQALDESQWLICEKPELRIISDELFGSAGDIMARRRDRFCSGQRHSSEHLFSNLIYCSCCGGSFRRITRTYKNTYVRWVCSRRNARGAESCVNSAALDEGELIRAIDEYFLSLLPSPPELERLLGSLSAEPVHTGDQPGLTRQIKKLEQKRAKYLELYADELISRGELEQKLAENSRLSDKLKEALDALPDHTLPAAMAQRLPQAMSIAGLGSARLRQLIEKIEAQPDGSAHVYLKKPADSRA